MRSTRVLLSATLFLAAFHAFPQGTMPDPDAILVGRDPRPQVLLLGTFHFGYPDMDKHVTAEDDRVDVLSPQRQQELTELLDAVMRFNPTKLCVETQGGWLMHEYHRYKKGERTLGRNEFYQIDFRVMDRAKLDTMYAVDALPLVLDLYNGADSMRYKPWLDSLYQGWEFGGEDVLSQRYDAWYTATDKAKKDHSLLEIFLAMNDDDLYRRACDLIVVYEGLHTSGGLAGRDMEAMAIGIRESIDDNHIRARVGQVEYLGEKIAAAGVPIVRPIGGYGMPEWLRVSIGLESENARFLEVLPDCLV